MAQNRSAHSRTPVAQDPMAPLSVPDAEELAQDLEQRCVDAGVKMTDQRRKILRVLCSASDHPSVEDLHHRVREVDASISMATVYRTMKVLDELGLVQRHDFGDNFDRFEVNEVHHHHLVDLDSGEIIEFQNQEIEDLKARIAEELGYDLVQCRLELFGRKRPRA